MFTSSAGSTYFRMCDIRTGEMFIGRLYPYSKTVLKFEGMEEVNVRKSTETGWITKKEQRPILSFFPFKETAVQVGDMWVELDQDHGS
jgi:hypothetical protein